MSRHAVEANKQMLSNVWYRRCSLRRSGFVVVCFGAAFPLPAFGRVDMGSTVVTQWCDETV
jgi:hypothetical protein